MQDNGKLKNLNNAQRHSPRPLPNDWCYFRHTLVFAGHYLKVKFLSLIYILIWRGGAGTRAANGGVSEDPTSDFYTRFGWTTSDPSRGRGGGGHALTPSLQAAITAENGHHARSDTQNFPLKSNTGCGFPAMPHARQPSPAHVFLQNDIKVFIWSPLPSTLLTTHTDFFGPLSVQSVCLEFSTHCWSIKS
jgi:hypothetical protein